MGPEICSTHCTIAVRALVLRSRKFSNPRDCVKCPRTWIRRACPHCSATETHAKLKQKTPHHVASCFCKAFRQELVWLSETRAWTDVKYSHCSEEPWASWRPKSLVTRMFVQQLIQDNSDRTSKLRIHWPFVRGATIQWWIPPQKTTSMALCKTAVSPLLTHWRYYSLILSHRVAFPYHDVTTHHLPAGR